MDGEHRIMGAVARQLAALETKGQRDAVELWEACRAQADARGEVRIEQIHAPNRDELLDALVEHKLLRRISGSRYRMRGLQPL